MTPAPLVTQRAPQVRPFNTGDAVELNVSGATLVGVVYRSVGAFTHVRVGNDTYYARSDQLRLTEPARVKETRVL